MVTRPKPAPGPAEPAPGWRDAIVGYDPGVDPGTLRANPANAREHGPAQREAIRRTIGQVGWVAPVVVNRRSGLIVDGHARVELAAEAGERVPVVWVDLDADTERQVLATFDPLGYMASYDEHALASLLANVGPVQDDLDRLLASIAADAIESSEPGGIGDILAGDAGDEDDEELAGSMLGILDVSIEDPAIKPERGSTWRLGGNVLHVGDVIAGWDQWVPLLEPDMLLVPYPGPFIAIGLAKSGKRAVLVQPDTYLAGHVLVKWASVNPGDPPQLLP